MFLLKDAQYLAV